MAIIVKENVKELGNGSYEDNQDSEDWDRALCSDPELM